MTAAEAVARAAAEDETSRLVVFGATGGTGRQIVRQALHAGHQVRVLARTPASLGIRHPALDVLGGNVLEPRDVRAVIGPSDRVVSALGVGHSRAATTVYSTGTANMLAAMERTGARRLVCLSTCGLETGPAASAVQRLVTRQVLHRLLHRPYADIADMESLVREAPVDWTVVRAARLTDGRPTGRYRVGAAGTQRDLWSISRADLADYLLRALDEPDRVGRTVEIAY